MDKFSDLSVASLMQWGWVGGGSNGNNVIRLQKGWLPTTYFTTYLW